MEQLIKIHVAIATTIKDKAANHLTQEPRGNDSKALRGKYRGLWRYMVGGYILTYAIEEELKLIVVTGISHRRDGC